MAKNTKTNENNSFANPHFSIISNEIKTTKISLENQTYYTQAETDTPQAVESIDTPSN